MGDIIPFPQRQELDAAEYIDLREDEAGNWRVTLHSPDAPDWMKSPREYPSKAMAVMRVQSVRTTLGREVPLYTNPWLGGVA